MLLSHMLITYQCAPRITLIAKRVDSKGAIQSYNFGTVTNDYMTTDYDKRTEGELGASVVFLV